MKNTAIAVLGICAALLAGCGGGEDDDPPTINSFYLSEPATGTVTTAIPAEAFVDVNWDISGADPVSVELSFSGPLVAGGTGAAVLVSKRNCGTGQTCGTVQKVSCGTDGQLNFVCTDPFMSTSPQSLDPFAIGPGHTVTLTACNGGACTSKSLAVSWGT